MHRFYLSQQLNIGDIYQLENDDKLHAAKSLRLKANDEVIICDGNCNDYNAVITDDVMNIKITGLYKRIKEPCVYITLFQAMPKADKLEFILQKCTEIGVSEFFPFFSSRCVVKPSKNDKTMRYSKICLEAAKQSRRGIVPKSNAPLSYNDTLKKLENYELVLLAWEDSQTPLKSVLQNTQCKNIAVIIGPEGGFSSSEAADFGMHGAKNISLGNRILRTETAGISLASNILYELEG